MKLRIPNILDILENDDRVAIVGATIILAIMVILILVWVMGGTSSALH